MCVCPELLSFIPFDVLLSVNHGRTDASPLISSSAVKGEHGYILCSLPVLPYLWLGNPWSASTHPPTPFFLDCGKWFGSDDLALAQDSVCVGAVASLFIQRGFVYVQCSPFSLCSLMSGGYLHEACLQGCKLKTQWSVFFWVRMKARPSLLADSIHPLNHRVDRTHWEKGSFVYQDYSSVLTACSHRPDG